MRTLQRNKRLFWYALYQERIQRTDDYGNLTGEYDILRANPVKSSANISSAKGEADTRLFGESENYDKVLVMDTYAPAIDEYTVLWIDTMPRLDEKGALARNAEGEILTPYDYIVTKVARSLNSVSIAVRKVNVRG